MNDQLKGISLVDQHDIAVLNSQNIRARHKRPARYRIYRYGLIGDIRRRGRVDINRNIIHPRRVVVVRGDVQCSRDSGRRRRDRKGMDAEQGIRRTGAIPIRVPRDPGYPRDPRPRGVRPDQSIGEAVRRSVKT